MSYTTDVKQLIFLYMSSQHYQEQVVPPLKKRGEAAAKLRDFLNNMQDPGFDFLEQQARILEHVRRREYSETMGMPPMITHNRFFEYMFSLPSRRCNNCHRDTYIVYYCNKHNKLLMFAHQLPWRLCTDKHCIHCTIRQNLI